MARRARRLPRRREPLPPLPASHGAVSSAAGSNMVSGPCWGHGGKGKESRAWSTACGGCWKRPLPRRDGGVAGQPGWRDPCRARGSAGRRCPAVFPPRGSPPAPPAPSPGRRHRGRARLGAVALGAPVPELSPAAVRALSAHRSGSRDSPQDRRVMVRSLRRVALWLASQRRKPDLLGTTAACVSSSGRRNVPLSC